MHTAPQGKRPLMPPGMDMNPEVKEVVTTFRMLSELPADRCAGGACINGCVLASCCKDAVGAARGQVRWGTCVLAVVH